MRVRLEVLFAGLAIGSLVRRMLKGVPSCLCQCDSPSEFCLEKFSGFRCGIYGMSLWLEEWFCQCSFEVACLDSAGDGRHRFWMTVQACIRCILAEVPFPVRRAVIGISRNGDFRTCSAPDIGLGDFRAKFRACRQQGFRTCRIVKFRVCVHMHGLCGVGRLLWAALHGTSEL